MPTAMTRPGRGPLGPWPDLRAYARQPATSPSKGEGAGKKGLYVVAVVVVVVAALCCPTLTFCWPSLDIRRPILPLCWPKQRGNTKNRRKTNGKPRFSATILGLGWPILGAMLAHLGAMLTHRGVILTQLGGYVGPS